MTVKFQLPFSETLQWLAVRHSESLPNRHSAL